MKRKTDMNKKKKMKKRIFGNLFLLFFVTAFLVEGVVSVYPEASALSETDDALEESVASEASATAEPSVTSEPSVIAEPSVTLEPSAMPEPSATSEPSAVPEPSVTAEPSVTPEPSATPEVTPTPETESDKVDLKELYVSTSDTYGKGLQTLSPALHKDKDRYKVAYDGERESLNIWATAQEATSKIEVYSLSGVKSSTVQKDETIKVSQDKDGHSYWKIYFQEQFKEALLRIQVTDDQGNRRDYYLTLTIQDRTAPTLKKITASRISTNKASLVFKSSERGQVYYRVIDAGKKQKNPNTSKTGKDVIKGSNTLTLTGLTAGKKNVVLQVKDDSGNVSSPLVIHISDAKKSSGNSSGGNSTNSSNSSNSGNSDNNGNSGNSGSSGNLVQRKGYGSNKSQASSGISGQSSQGSLTKVKGTGSKSQNTSSTQNGENGSQNLTSYSGSKDETSSKSKSKKSSKKKSTSKKSKKKESLTAKNTKKEDSNSDDALEENSKNSSEAGEKESAVAEKSSGSLSAVSTKEEGETAVLGSKIMNTWKDTSLLTKLMLLFALVGALYIIFWAKARHTFRKGQEDIIK